MKNKLVKNIIGLLTFIFVLTGCSQNEVELATVTPEKTSKGFVIENGYIKFENQSCYRSIYEKLSSSTNLELTVWNKNLPFKSLEIKYNEDKVERYLYDSNSTNEINSILNTKIVSSILASLYNEKGIMMINDTIFKIKDEYQYIITNGDFSLIDKIDKNIEFKSDYVLKQKHTIIIEPTKNENPEGMKKLISDNSRLFYVASNKREFINFQAYISGGYINFDLKGRWQSKFLFTWLFDAPSSMVYGQINAIGTWGDITLNTNNSKLYGYEVVNMNYFVGNPAYIPFDLNVTYNYKKTNSTAYIDGWNGTLDSTEHSFTKNYHWSQF